MSSRLVCISFHRGTDSLLLPCIQRVIYTWQVLKPGGMLLFRDYGLYDHAMLRFGRGHKLSDHFYVRQDGTRAYYFSEGAQSGIMAIS